MTLELNCSHVVAPEPEADLVAKPKKDTFHDVCVRADRELQRIISGVAPAPAEDPAVLERDRQHARQRELQSVFASMPPSLRSPATRADLVGRVRDSRLLAAVESWRWGDGNIILSGRTGVGKTTAAGLLVRRLCGAAVRLGGETFERARFIRWQSCRLLSRVVRETKLGAGTPDEIVRCQNARLLVLDDLGSTDDRETLEVLLDVREGRGWPTITTTGLRASDLLEFFGDALNRRIFQCWADRGSIVETDEPPFAEPAPERPLRTLRSVR